MWFMTMRGEQNLLRAIEIKKKKIGGNHTFFEIQSTPDNSNLQVELKKV